MSSSRVSLFSEDFPELSTDPNLEVAGSGSSQPEEWGQARLTPSSASQEHENSPGLGMDLAGGPSSFNFSFADSDLNLPSLIRTVAQANNLSERSTAELEKLSSANTIKECLVIMFGSILKHQERERTSGWKMSEDLKANIAHISRAFLLSGKITYYRGHVAAQVLRYLRAHNPRGLPDESDNALNAKVMKQIGSQLTIFRNVMKEALIQSLEPNSEIRNIANLTATIVGSNNIPITAQLYLRIAFLRWVMIKLPGANIDEWWKDAADDMLSDLRAKFTSESALTVSLNRIYEKDIELYGDPASTRIRTVEPRLLPDWLAKVSKFAEQVEPQLVTAAQPKRKKRKAVEGNESD